MKSGANGMKLVMQGALMNKTIMDIAVQRLVFTGTNRVNGLQNDLPPNLFTFVIG